MNSVAEIDKAGRVVVPKKLRDALHLVPGTRLALYQDGDHLVIAPEARPRGLYMKKGTLVYDAGRLPPLEDTDWVQEDREARIDSILGDLTKP